MAMKRLIQILGDSIALLLFCLAPRGAIASDQKLAATEFIGSTLGDALPREFLGGLATNAPCHCMGILAKSVNSARHRAPECPQAAGNQARAKLALMALAARQDCREV